MKDLSRLPVRIRLTSIRPPQAMMALEFNHRTVNLTVGDYTSKWIPLYWGRYSRVIRPIRQISGLRVS